MSPRATERLPDGGNLQAFRAREPATVFRVAGRSPVEQRIRWGMGCDLTRAGLKVMIGQCRSARNSAWAPRPPG